MFGHTVIFDVDVKCELRGIPQRWHIKTRLYIVKTVTDCSIFDGDYTVCCAGTQQLSPSYHPLAPVRGLGFHSSQSPPSAVCGRFQHEQLAMKSVNELRLSDGLTVAVAYVCNVTWILSPRRRRQLGRLAHSQQRCTRARAKRAAGPLRPKRFSLRCGSSPSQCTCLRQTKQSPS